MKKAREEAGVKKNHGMHQLEPPPHKDCVSCRGNSMGDNNVVFHSFLFVFGSSHSLRNAFTIHSPWEFELSSTLLVVSAVVVIDKDVVITAALDNAVPAPLVATISDSFSSSASSCALLKLSSRLLIRMSRRALITYSSALKAFLLPSFLWPMAPTNVVEGVHQLSLNCSSDSSNCRYCHSQ